MMRQGKIKNLIQLMNKIHSQKKQQHYIVIQQFQDELEQYKQVDNDQGSTYNRNKTTLQQDSNEMNASNQVGIFFTQDAIKPRFDQKKTLYQVYRDSLQKKKLHLNTLLTNKNKRQQKTPHSQDQMRYTKDICFPIRQNTKLRDRRSSQNYQQFKKKSLCKEHISIPFLPHQPQPISKKKPNLTQGDADDKFNLYEQMRNKKLDYKPMFRVKRIALQNSKTESAERQDQSKFEKYSFCNKQGQMNRNTFFRQRIKDKKRKSKILLNKIDRFSAWDSGGGQKTQDSELVTKLC